MAQFAIPLLVSGIMTGASYGINALARRKQKPQYVDRGRNSDLRITAPGYGEFIPRIWGKVRFAPLLIYSSGVREVITETREQTGGGGKGGGGRQTVVNRNFSYYTTLDLLLCRNEIQSVPRLWADNNLIYNFQPDPNLHYFEAEAGTRAGGASVTADPGCSSGNKVTGVGNGGTLSFNLPNPTFPIDAYTNVYTILTVYYKSPANRTLYVSADGATPVAHSFAAASNVQTQAITLDSHPDNITFSNAGGAAPDIDRISVWFSYTSTYPVDLPVTGIDDPFMDFPRDEFTPFPKYNFRPIKEAETGIYQFSTPQTAGIRVYTGTETQEPDSAIVAELDKRFGAGVGIEYASGSRGMAHVVLDNRLLPNSQPENYTAEVDQGTTQVTQILTDLYTEKNIDASVLNLTALAGLTRQGLIVPEMTAPGKIIADLEKWYQFKMVEADSKITAYLNNSAPIATITADDLRAHFAGGEMPSSDAEIGDQSEQDLPQVVYVNAMNPDDINYHNEAESDSLHGSTSARDIRNYSFPFVAPKSETKEVATRLLMQEHNESRPYDFMAMPKWGKLTPGDCINLELANATHSIRIVKKQMALSGPVRLTGVSTDEINFTLSESQIKNNPDIVPYTAKFPANTELIVFESQAVNLNDNSLGVYVAVCSKGFGKWAGAALYAKYVETEEFSFIEQIEKSTPLGVATSTLADNAGTGIDTTHSFTVYFYEKVEFESVSADEIAAQPTRNLTRLGNEWLQFRTAVAASLPANSHYKSAWTFSNLSRGLFGTAAAKSTHASSERFMAYSANVEFVRLDSAYFGKNVTFAAASFGQLLENAATKNLTITGLSLIGPNAPGDLESRVNPLAPTLTQIGASTLDKILIAVGNYTIAAKFRKIEVAGNSGFTSGLATTFQDVEGKAIGLPDRILIENVSSGPVTKYLRVSHSFDGITYHASATLTLTFENESGDGVPQLSGSAPTLTYDGTRFKFDIPYPQTNWYGQRAIHVEIYTPAHGSNSLDNYSASADAIAVANASYFPDSGKGKNNETQEIFSWTGKSVNILTGCVRGLEGSTAQAIEPGDFIMPAEDRRNLGDGYYYEYSQDADEHYFSYRAENRHGYSPWSSGIYLPPAGAGSQPPATAPPPAEDPPIENEDPFNTNKDRQDFGALYY